MIKQSKGITLVALVITIIILIILAGITISKLTQNGLFEKAQNVKNDWINAQNNENLILSEYETTISTNLNDDTIQFEENLVDYWPLKDSLKNKKEGNDLVIYKGNNTKFENDSMYLNNTIITTKENYLLPKNFTISFKYKPTEELKAWTLILGKITDYPSLNTYNGLFIHRNVDTTRICSGINSDYFSIDEILKIGSYSTIAITYDGADCKLYKDAKLIKQVSGYNDLNDKIFIGGSKYSGTLTAGMTWEYANGYFKDIMIYDIALSQEELNSIK